MLPNYTAAAQEAGYHQLSQQSCSAANMNLVMAGSSLTDAEAITTFEDKYESLIPLIVIHKSIHDPC